MSSPLSFIILIDALRHDYITAEQTPYLHSLKQNSRHATVIESYSFQTRPAYFAGLEPEESNICHLYEYNLEESPFSFLRPLSPILQALDSSGSGSIGRGIIRRLAKRRATSLGHPAAADVMGTEKIPLHLLAYFALSEKQYTDTPGVYAENKTIFDLLREKQKTWAWIGYPKHFGSTSSILDAYHRNKPADVAYLHFSELDWTGHRHGPDSPELRNNLKEIDSTLQDLLSPTLEKGGNAILFGDHGMVEVEYSVDLLSCLQSLSAKCPEDYLFFLDSTQARFWFFRDKAESEIRAALEGIEGGHVLSPKERTELRINFQDNRYGDLIFAIDGPGIIHPSFFGNGSSHPKGMHGYLPHIKDNMTQVLSVGPGVENADLDTIALTDIFHEICQTVL